MSARPCVEIAELLTLATGICPYMSEAECRAVFRHLDADGNAKVRPAHGPGGAVVFVRSVVRVPDSALNARHHSIRSCLHQREGRSPKSSVVST